MKKFHQTTALVALLLLCCNFSFAQSPVYKNTIEIDIVSLVSSSSPNLMYLRQISKGELRFRGSVSPSHTRNYDSAYEFLGNDGFFIWDFQSTLAIGWQNELRKKRFGFYWGGELIGQYNRVKSIRYVYEEPLPNIPGYEEKRESWERAWAVGISGVLGARYHLSDKVSFGLETGFPLILQFNETTTELLIRDFTTTSSTVYENSTYNRSVQTLNFSPLQGTFLFINFHI